MTIDRDRSPKVPGWIPPKSGHSRRGPSNIAVKILIVLIVRNAEIVASRNSTTINPGTVDVAVFPPIPAR